MFISQSDIIPKRAELLKRINVFSYISSEETLLAIAGLLREHIFEADAPIFSKGDPSNYLYIIDRGSVIVHDGDYIFNVLMTGEVFGEYALIDDGERSACVTSVTQTVILELNKADLEHYPEAYIQLIRSLAKVLTSRLRSSNQLESKLAETNDNIRKQSNEIKKQQEELQQQNEEIITQRDLLEDVNKELEKLSIVASKTTNAISILDAEGNYIWINDSFTKMYGFKLDQLIQTKGKNIYDNPEFKHLAMQLNCKGQLDETVHVEYVTQTKSGEKFWAKSTLTPIFKENGEPTKIVVIDSDINELKLAETEILQQKEEIEAQNNLLSNVNDELFFKNKQMFDSINYARRIQQALLPDETQYGKYFNEYFILFQPKNIVSGDFHWIKFIESDFTGSRQLAIAIADCTGHGVPGAFMSMLGISSLNELTGFTVSHEHKQINSDTLLFNLRKQLIASLKQTGKQGEQRDGMDISLCVFNADELEKADSQSINFQYTGANIPLFIVSKAKSILHNEVWIEPVLSGKTNDFHLFEIKPDRMPICYYLKGELPFTKNNIQIPRDSTIYFFSDGFYDQQGGLYKDKYYKTTFRSLILEIASQPLEEQKQKLSAVLSEWKGSLEQTDDITVIGLKI